MSSEALPLKEPEPTPIRTTVLPSYAHFVAGGVAGLTGAVLTSPLDVVKTRLQSDFYRDRLPSQRLIAGNPGPVKKAVYHFLDTGKMLTEIYRIEGSRALFRGLGPTLVGVVPARCINFFTYGNGKTVVANLINDGQESPLVHLLSAALAGIVTSTATNPIWLVKTRLQLDKNAATGQRRYKNSLDCVRQVLKQEGVRGLYRGLSASFLGVSESTIQWVSYEYFKGVLARRTELRRQKGLVTDNALEKTIEWSGKLGAAAGAKLMAAIVAYPHEVVRTRLRQSPTNGKAKYTGLVQCFNLVWKEEGMGALYGGLTAHLMRVVPNAAIMFGSYEVVLSMFAREKKVDV